MLIPQELQIDEVQEALVLIPQELQIDEVQEALVLIPQEPQIDEVQGALVLVPQELPIDEVQEALVIVPQDHISKFETENPKLNEELFRDINKLLVEKFKGVSLSFTKNE